VGGGLPVIDLPDRGRRAEAMVLSEEEAPPPAPPPAPEDVRVDPTIGRMVAAERRAGRANDLLSEAAPEE
jgi:hypothetical protein